jgi:hypothetical protein
MSWLSGWNYKRPITVTNNTTNDLTNYQVLITIDTASLISAGKMRSDGGDIRFTDSDGVTLINYWVESGINTTSTKIWVEVPSIPASGSTTIYLYYGNPSATTTSNGDATFIFFDHFDGATLNTNKWTVIQGGASVSSSLLHVYYTTVDGKVKSNNAFGPYGRIRYRAYLSGSITIRTAEVGLQYPPGSATDIVQTEWSNAYFKLRTYSGGTGGDTTGSSFSASTFYVIDITWRSGEAKQYKDGTLDITRTTNVPSVALNYWLYCQGSIDLYVDYVIFMSWVYPEPTVSIGSEEPPLTIAANSFPMLYIAKPIKAQELISKVVV